MKTALRLLRFQLGDLLRARWLLAYAAFFFVAGEGLLRLGGGDARALLSLGNLVLLVVPLVALLFGTTRLFDARDFDELLLSQPIGRPQLFAASYGALALGLSGAFAVGVVAPFLLHGLVGVHAVTLATLVGAGVLLTLVFVAIAFGVALTARDKARALAMALGIWLFAGLIYDGAVLVAANALAAYPLERAMIAVMMLNPIDLARVLLLMQLDVAALMGYTGAVFQRFFGSGAGAAALLGALAAWTVVPVALGLRAFRRKDF